MTLLFAYGTLRDPKYQREFFGRRLPPRPATLSGWTAIVSASGYLTLVPAPGKTVRGDLLALDDGELARADAWEGLAYARVRVETRDANGVAVPAEVYVRSSSESA